jgi:hypothetical protein
MNREIGPVGTATRVVGGLVAIALPIIFGGIDWWNLGGGLVVLPLAAFLAQAVVTSLYRRFAPEALARREAICSGPACCIWAILILAAVALAALTPTTMVAFSLWLGASLLIAAARGYGGCELLAFPNLLTGRREQIGCLIYTPIDAAERRRRERAREGALARG